MCPSVAHLGLGTLRVGIRYCQRAAVSKNRLVNRCRVTLGNQASLLRFSGRVNMYIGVAMYFARPEFFFKLIGHFFDLEYGPVVASSQRRHAETCNAMCQSNVEPSASLRVKVAVWICRRPSISGEPDNLLFDVDQSSVSHALFGECAVKAHRAIEPVHSIQQLIEQLGSD